MCEQTKDAGTLAAISSRGKIMVLTGTHIINLTPHMLDVHVNIHDSNGVMGIMEIAPSGTVARVEETLIEAGIFEGKSLYIKEMGTDVIDLPEVNVKYHVQMIYVVSFQCAKVAWAQGRVDVVTPGPAIRDEKGRITGCAGYCANPDIKDGIPWNKSYGLYSNAVIDGKKVQEDRPVSTAEIMSESLG